MSARRYLAISAVAERYNKHPATIWYWARTRPDFPRPIRFGGRTTCFDVAELDAYDERLKAQRGTPEERRRLAPLERKKLAEQGGKATALARRKRLAEAAEG